jgi:RNA polymerase Rpb2, domain 5
VDCHEENNSLIAVTERDLEAAIKQGLETRRMKFTHLEVDPFTVLGVVGGVIPVRRLRECGLRAKRGRGIWQDSDEMIVVV